MSTTSSAAAAATTSAAAAIDVSPKLKIVGIVLAICSGLLIGSSFVFKKKGLLRAQAGQVAGEGVAYLKSPLWWTGMIMMICGELCNFAAYAFVEAIIVTPLGALSVVICAILSSIFLNEKLSTFGWLGCILCILGSTIIALNGPQEQTIGQITQFQALFLAPGFLVYAGVLFAGAFSIIFYFGPRHGKKHMLWYISVCSLIGGISVSVTTGLGSAIVTTAMGDNQFKHWFIYFLFIFVAVTLVTEVYYLNVALALFNTAMVTPTYYVLFTFCSLVTTVILFQGLKASASQILTIVMAFFTICIGITILQMSKVDPTQLKGLDRRSTMLLQAARANTQAVDEKNVLGVEDPGMDTLRGSFGTFGSIIRARSARRMSMASGTGGGSGGRAQRSRHGSGGPFADPEAHGASMYDGASQDASNMENTAFPGMKRHQLFDNPVPRPDMFRGESGQSAELRSIHSDTSGAAANRAPTIKFGDRDLVHTWTADGEAAHDYRTVRGPKVSVAPLHFATSPLAEEPPQNEPAPALAPPAELDMSGTFGRLANAGLGLALPASPAAGSASTSASATPVADRFARPTLHDPFAVSNESLPRDRYSSTAVVGTPNMFADQHIHGSASIDSLSSVLDGGGSDGRPSFGSEDEHALSTPRGKGIFGRQPSPRRYPSGHAQEDTEESVRLFKQGPRDEDEMSDASATSARGAGIRLVGPPVGTERF